MICSNQGYELYPKLSPAGTDIVPAGTVYSWTTQSTTGNLANSTGTGTKQDKFTQTLTNTSNVRQTIIYLITPSAIVGGKECTGASFTLTLQVDPTEGMTLTSPDVIDPICSGGNVNYTATSSISTATFSWERLANNDIVESVSSGTNNIINETLTNTGNTTTTVRYIFTLTNGTCTNIDDVIVRVYGKLNGGKIGIAGTTEKKDTVCHNSAPKQLTLSGVAGGIGTYTYQWQSKPVGADENDAWTDIGSNTDTYTPPAPLTESLMYRVETTDSKCDAIHSDTAMIIVEPVSMLVYPDLRIYTCNNLPTRLSQFIDSTGIRNIDWTPVGVAPAISIDGKIAADVLQAGATYTYTYAVTNACTSGVKSKIYLHVLGKNKDFHLRTDTVAVCYLHANNLQINRIFGLDDGGEITYTGTGVEPFMVKPVAPSAYEGSLVFNGKDAYEASGVLTPITYHGDARAKAITFTYTTAINGCLKGKKYKVVVVLTFF